MKTAVIPAHELARLMHRLTAENREVVMRYVVGFGLVLALGVMPLVGCSEASGTGGSAGDAGSAGVGAQLPEDESTKPEDAYGKRYAMRQLIIPKGMIRGSFDVVFGELGDVEDFKLDGNTTTINFGRFA